MGNSKSLPDKINASQEDEMTIAGYKKSLGKTVLMYLFLLLSGGTLLLLLTWKSSIHLKFTHTQCPLEKADKVLLKDAENQESVEMVIRPQRNSCLPYRHTYFYNKKIKYIWKEEKLQFIKVCGFSTLASEEMNSGSCANFHNMTEGLSEVDALYRRQLFGDNSILVEIKPIYKLILNEIRGPFYIYQMFIVIIWMIQLYYQFAVCIVLLSVISVSATVWETRKQSRALRDKVHSHSIVTVLRDNAEIQKSSHELVPGDVFILPQKHFIVECDAVLISGSCVVNESMLTGESVPITKIPISADPVEEYNPVIHKRNTLFCGTEILYSRACEDTQVKAVVYRTGFSTAKGELVRAILFPKTIDFKIYSDLFKSLMIFLFLGIPAVVYTTVVWIKLQADVKDIIIIVLDVLTFLIPPVLPAVMTSINAHAQRRLRRESIFCLNSRYINLCGGLDVVCFDKTGTLTEDGLNISGVIPVQDGKFQETVKDLTQLSPSALVIALATCHSLTKVNDELLGDTLDVKMFEAIGWEFKEPEQEISEMFEKMPARIVHPPKCYSNEQDQKLTGIIRQFPFESLLQRMTVVTKTVCDDGFDVYIKGAPEMIFSLSLKSTVPENFKELLEGYTRQGFRVLGIGWKSLSSSLSWDDAMKIHREDLECDFHFQGLLVLQNHLKPESLPAIMTLQDADIRTVMVTGDNLLTAITVARECGMIKEADSVISLEAQLISNDNCLPNLKVCYSYSKLPGYSEKLNVGQNGMIEEMFLPLVNEEKYHLAMEGTTFHLIRNQDDELLHKIVQKGTIFARMLPEQKLQLIDALQTIGHQVGMCGDGANDCGALKAANAGVSLSVAEASVASPFTSKVENIECIPKLIREGRATLTATFGACRYMVCYCFILLSAVLTMFWDGQKPSDGAYVIIDIVMNLLPPIVFGGTEPYHSIAKIPPVRTILSFLPQFSIISFIALQTGVNIFTHYYCISQSWYEPFEYNHTTTHHPQPSHLGTTIITVNMMSYVIAAVIFATGPPYRKPFFTNKIYTAVILFEFCLASYLSIYPDSFMMRYLNFKRAPYIDYHLILYGICLGNFVISYIWEVYFVQGFLFHQVVPAIRRMRGPIHNFEKIDEQISTSRNWPPVGKYEIIRPFQHSQKLKSDKSRRPSSQSLQKRWSRHSNDIRNSLVAGLRISTSDYKDERSEPLTFSTFQDGNYSHAVLNETNNQTVPAHDSFV